MFVVYLLVQIPSYTQQVLTRVSNRLRGSAGGTTGLYICDDALCESIVVDHVVDIACAACAGGDLRKVVCFGIESNLKRALLLLTRLSPASAYLNGEDLCIWLFSQCFRRVEWRRAAFKCFVVTASHNNVLQTPSNTLTIPLPTERRSYLPALGLGLAPTQHVQQVECP